MRNVQGLGNIVFVLEIFLVTIRVNIINFFEDQQKEIF